ncbi:MAG: DNA-processing protein DprA [Alphaproteobacteria bacterium]|nr:DNA-processing protein DprA [Alphaproteobacteria bacterium]
MWNNERLAQLQLYRTDQIGPAAYHDLIQTYGSAVEALKNLPDIAKKSGRKRPIKIKSISEIEQEITRLEKANGHFIFETDEIYPDLLKSISDAPPVLSALGDINLLQSKKIAVVGTRNCSYNGQIFASNISAQLVENDYTVVSGMARGIDCAAHTGALKNASQNVSTIAVLGTGINVPYPEENRKLYDALREKGLILSEFAIDTAPQPGNFPARNRIVSGLSLGVVVVESAIKSGAMLTANNALDQGREIFAVPGFPLDSHSSGVNYLIKNGAFLTENVNDILENIPNSLNFFPSPPKKTKKKIKIEPEFSFDIPKENGEKSKILNMLSSTPVELDNIIRNTGLAPDVISGILVELELDNQIERLPANQFIRKSTGL